MKNRDDKTNGHSSHPRLEAAVLGSLAALCAGGAWAQSPPASGSSGTEIATADVSQVEEVVVTALKRDTKLQDTPIAISAISGDTIAKSGVQNIGDFAKSVPSLTFVDSGPTSRQIVIRGIQAAGEPTVGLYYDETPVTGSVGASSNAGGNTPELALFDVERVEVLRGPQGTLYGSGSMGGTLRVIYNKPVYRYEANIDATVTTTDGAGGPGFAVSAMANMPVIADKLAVRVVLNDSTQGGWIDNTFLGRNNLYASTSHGGRVLVGFQPLDNLSIDGSAFLQRTNAASTSWSAKAGPYDSTAQALLPRQDDLDLYSLTARWDAGPVNVTAVGSYFKRQLSSTSDTSYFLGNMATAATCARLRNANSPCSPAQQTAFNNYVHGFVPSVLYPQQDMNAKTGELRMSSKEARWVDWTLGAFYSDRVNDVNNPDVLVNPATGYVIQPLQYATQRLIQDDLKQIAGFGEASYKVTSQLTFTAGARYFHYSKNIVGQTTIPFDLVGAKLTPPTTVSSDENGKVFKFNGSYKFNENVMVYADASQGFRPGGANQVLGLPQALTPYQSDSLWNYELGTKTTWFDRRLTLDVDGYWINWKNMQVTGQTPNGAFSFISNAGAARVKGLELELTTTPIPGLTLQANATLSQAELSEDQISSQVRAPGKAGDRIPYVPKVTAGASAQYAWLLFGQTDGYTRVDSNFVGESFTQFRPTDVNRRSVGDYALTNLRLGLENSSGGWDAYLFANNLFNRVGVLTVSTGGTTGGIDLVNATMPRTIGAEFRKKF
jgi:outer membrane receptor protein involved in Fe transport